MALASDELSSCRHIVEANDVCLRSKQLLNGGHQVSVMAKESHLRLLRKFKEGLEPRLRAVVIEVYEEVVCEEGKGRAILDLQFEGGYTQRKEQLVSRPVTQAGDGYNLLVRPLGEEGCRPLIEVDVEPLKGTLGQSLEHSARAFKHRTLLPVLVAFYSPPHKHV